MNHDQLSELEARQPHERLDAMLLRPEDQWFERKSARIAPKDLARSLVAFANAEGGTIIIGLHDGAFDGTSLTTARENDLRQAGMDFARPPVRNTVSRLDIGGGRRVLRIDVPVSEHVHETNTGEDYLRVGDESKRLTDTQRRELDYDRGAVHFEGEPVADATMDDLSSPALLRYRAAVGSTADDLTALRAR